MAEEENKPDQRKKTEKELADEQLKQNILAASDQVKGEQLIISPTGDLERQREILQTALSNIDDPEKKFDLYYKGINRLLRGHLPKGPSNKAARDFIYEEKNTYLTRGKRIRKDGTRGGDGRMTYNTDADEMLQIIMEWIMENSTMVDLFNKLRDLNISKGYGTRAF
jgi:hypothetical protein